MQLSFFRKHEKLFYILMFLGVLGFLGVGIWGLLADWLTEATGTAPDLRVVGRIGDQEVTLREYNVFKARLETAGGIFGRGSAWYQLRQFGGDPEDPATVLAWLALYRDALDMGFGVSQEQVQATLKAIQEANDIPAEALTEQVLRAARGNREFAFEAMRTDRTLANYFDWNARVLALPTTPGIRQQFVEMFEKIKVDLVTLEAESFVEDVDEPTDEQLREHFNKYKDVPPGAGTFGFGYRVPAKVAIEYLEARPELFMEKAADQVTDEDVAEYYESNKAEFEVEPPEEDGDEAAADDAEEEDAEDEPGEAAHAEEGATAEEDGERDTPAEDGADEDADAEPTYKPLEEVEDEIRDKLLREAAERLATDRLQEVLRIIRNTPTTEPLATYDGPDVDAGRTETLMTAEELRQRFGASHIRTDRSLTATAMRNSALVEDPAAAAIDVMSMSEVFVRDDGTPMAFRIPTDAEGEPMVEPAHPPDSMADVLDEVKADARIAMAVDAAEARADELLAAAEEKGLKAAAEEGGVAVRRTPWFGRRGPETMEDVPEALTDRRFLMKAFDLDPETDPRFKLVQPSRHQVVVAEWVDRQPPGQRLYDIYKMMLMGQVRRELSRYFVAGLLDPSDVRKRFSVVDLFGSKEGEAEPAEDTEGEEGEAGEDEAEPE